VSLPFTRLGPIAPPHRRHLHLHLHHSSLPPGAYTMNPHISLPRPTGGPSNFGSTTPSSRRNEIKMPRFFKRLFKFPQMDFEMAMWEIMSLIIAPKKVFRQIYYHVRTSSHIVSIWAYANLLCWCRNKLQKLTTALTPPLHTSSACCSPSLPSPGASLTPTASRKPCTSPSSSSSATSCCSRC